MNLFTFLLHDDTSEASQAARRKGIGLKVVSVEDENVPPDTKQIIAITGDASVCNYLYLIELFKYI